MAALELKTDAYLECQCKHRSRTTIVVLVHPSQRHWPEFQSTDQSFHSILMYSHFLRPHEFPAYDRLNYAAMASRPPEQTPLLFFPVRSVSLQIVIYLQSLYSYRTGTPIADCPCKFIAPSCRLCSHPTFTLDRQHSPKYITCGVGARPPMLHSFPASTTVVDQYLVINLVVSSRKRPFVICHPTCSHHY